MKAPDRNLTISWRSQLTFTCNLDDRHHTASKTTIQPTTRNASRSCPGPGIRCTATRSQDQDLQLFRRQNTRRN